jgi:hypothetical protein
MSVLQGAISADLKCCNNSRLKAVSKSLHALKHAHFDFISQKTNVALLRARAALWKQHTMHCTHATQACNRQDSAADQTLQF